MTCKRIYISPRTARTIGARYVVLAGTIAISVAGTAVSALPTEEYGTGSNTVLNFYQEVLSPAKGGNTCPMHPSCSQYAKMAIAENPVGGATKMFDRLMRCGKDNASYETDDETGKLYDPPGQDECRRKSSGAVPPEVASIIGIQLPKRLSDSMSGTSFLLLHRRFDDALKEAYKDLYGSYLKKEWGEQLLQTGRIHLAANDFKGFHRLYRIFTSGDTLSPEYLAEFDLLLAKCFYFENEFEKSLSSLSLVDTSRSSTSIKDEIYFVSSLNYVQRSDFAKAISAAGAISRQSPRFQFAERCRRLDSLLPAARFRSPGMAGALSAIVPGLGYAYSGREKTAVVAAIINGLFIWTAAEAFMEKNYSLGSTAALLGSGWYFGNIYGAITSAKKHNVSLKIEFIRHALINP